MSLTKAEREAIPLSGFARPEEHKYPITLQARLDAAAKLIRRASVRAVARQGVRHRHRATQGLRPV
jgi:hypothetical protein